MHVNIVNSQDKVRVIIKKKKEKAKEQSIVMLF